MSGDSANIAQIKVQRSTQAVYRGSGYRVGDNLVLTAAHVVEDAEQITLTFNVDLPTQWEAVAEVAARCRDLALLQIKPPTHQSDANRIYARFGRVGSRVSTVAFTALGFPVWQLRVDSRSDSAMKIASRFRDSAQISGSFPTGSSWREGMLELLVDQPPAELDLNGDPALAGVKSEWEGMSGAAVWVQDRIVGVISAHVRSDGLGHLRATRLEQLLRHEDESTRRFRELLHLHVGTNTDSLADVIPIPHAERLALEFEGDVREVAPLALLDRDRELGDLTAFCLRDEQYLWIQAPAWSGKTALSSWLALNPPHRVTIVAFFIVKRQMGRADANAFLDAALAQLSVYAAENEQTPANLEEKRRRFGALLERAAAQSLTDGRRLTLLVDGLDEDVSSDVNLPSIASVLPSRPIRGLNVLVTGRPVPIPIDVPGSHPLRACRIYELNPSPHAKALEVAAKQELAATLRGEDDLNVEILAFLTVSGGGLTAHELQALTQAAKLGDIKKRLEGALERSLAVHSGYGGESIYLFGHATLAETAADHFLDEQHLYSERLHLWASTQARQGWSDATPQFLFGRYFRLLAALDPESLPLMVELATSEQRHDLMHARTNGDWDALAEIELTRTAVKMADKHQLEAAARLSIEYDRLVDRSAGVPLESGSLWARMGDSVRARMTANLITEPARKSSYLAQIAAAIADAGDVLQAREVAEEVSDFRTRLSALAVVAAKFAERQDYKQTEDIAEFLEESARAFPDRSVRADFLTLAAACFSLVGRTVRAEDLGGEVEDLATQFNQPKSPVRSAVVIAARLAALGQVERAWRISTQISEPTWHAEALCGVAPYLPEADRRTELVLKAVPRAREKYMALELFARTALDLRSARPDLAAEFFSAASNMRGYSAVPSAVGTLAISTAVFGGVSAGLNLLERLEPAARITWLCNMSRVLSEEGRLADALHCAKKAEAEAGIMTSRPDQARCLIDVAHSYLAAGGSTRAVELVERAEEIARQAVSRSSAKHWAIVAASLARAGRADCAEAIVEKIYGVVEQSDQLRLEIVAALTDTGQLEKALDVLRTITDVSQKFRGYLDVVTAYTRQGQRDLAEKVLAEVIDFYDDSEVGGDQAEVTSLIEHMVMVGWGDRAEALAASYAKANMRSSAAYAISRAAARLGDFDRALRSTAAGYLEAHRARSLATDGTGIIAVVEALNRGEAASVMHGFQQLVDERLRAIAAKWILKSSLELTDEYREKLSSFKGTPAYVNGVARALIAGEMPDRLSDVLSIASLSPDSETYLQALIEGLEAAVTNNRTDLGIRLLKTSRIPWDDGVRILGYCLAAHGRVGEAWGVLRDGKDVEMDDVARRIGDVGFLHKSVYGPALVSIAKEHAREGANRIADRLLKLIQRVDPKVLIDAIIVFLSEGSLPADKVPSLLSRLHDPSDRVKVLSQASRAFTERGDSKNAIALILRALNVLADAPADKRAGMLPGFAPQALSMDETKEASLALCNEVLSGPGWPRALQTLAVLDSGALDRVAEYLAHTCPTISVAPLHRDKQITV